MTWKIIWIWSESFLKQQFIALVTFLPFVMLNGMPKPIGWTNARIRNENLGKCLCSIGIIVTTRLEPHSSLDQSPVSSNLVILTFETQNLILYFVHLLTGRYGLIMLHVVHWFVDQDLGLALMVSSGAPRSILRGRFLPLVINNPHMIFWYRISIWIWQSWRQKPVIQMH